jgi:hypothetical protein
VCAEARISAHPFGSSSGNGVCEDSTIAGERFVRFSAQGYDCYNRRSDESANPRSGGCLCYFCCPFKPHEWKTGKIISQNIASDNGGAAVVPIGGIIAAVPIRRVSNTVVIEANGYRMTLVEKQNQHYLVLAENGGAQFYQDGKWFVFQDIEKKEHKFSLVHMEKIVAPQ